MNPLRAQQLLLITIFLIAGVFCFHGLRPQHQTPPASAAASVQGPTTNPPIIDNASASVVTILSDAAASSLETVEFLPLPPVPPAIQAILPSVTTAILNWREYRPESYTVKALPNQPEVTFHLEQIKDSKTATTWIGRSLIPGESFVAVASKDGLDAIVTTYEGQPVEIHIRGEKVAVSQAEAFTEDDRCAVLPNQDTSINVNAAQKIAAQETQPVSSGAVSISASALLDAAGNRLSRVACFYDAATLAYANLCAPDGNGASLIDATFRARLEAGNVALTNSQINVRWVYLGCVLAPTAASTVVQDIWNELRAAGTLGDFTRGKAREWGATEILYSSQTIAGSYAGYSSLPGNYATAYWNRNYFLMVHELGHNFGLRHDRYTDLAVAYPNDGIYAYAINLIFTTSTNRQIVGTIMSYAHYFVPYFSNANLTLSNTITTHFYTADYNASYQIVPPVFTPGTAGNFYYGKPNGTIDDTLITTTGAAADVQPLGIAAGQTYAADGSRTFREYADSTLRTGWYVEPVIITQPQNVTVLRGQSFTLSVATSGTGTPTYQWYKGAAVLSGATNASHSVASATNADAASYSAVVTMTDVTGSAVTLTSSNATVTVSEPAPTSNGGGGGGGAMNPGLLITLLVLVAARAHGWRSTR